MNNIEINDKGFIALNDKVMVSDPCYGMNTWCQGVIDNVLKGNYKCMVETSDEGTWGRRVSAIQVVHADYMKKFLEYSKENFEVGVDSGQAGIFDYEYYKKYHSDDNETEHVDNDWYWRVCDLTVITKKNPDYVKFVWDYNAEDMFEQLERHRKWSNNAKVSWPTIEILDGNTIDNLGFVSSSGYGDGRYFCWTAYNDEGKIVAIRVEYITEDDEEDM